MVELSVPLVPMHTTTCVAVRGYCPFNCATLVSQRHFRRLKTTPEKQGGRKNIFDRSALFQATVRVVFVDQRVLWKILNQIIQVNARGITESTIQRRRALLEVPQKLVHIGRRQLRHLSFFKVLIDEGQNVPRYVIRLNILEQVPSTAFNAYRQLFEDLPSFIRRQQSDLLEVDEETVEAQSFILHMGNKHGRLCIGATHDYLFSRDRVPGWSNVHYKRTKNEGLRNYQSKFDFRMIE